MKNAIFLIFMLSFLPFYAQVKDSLDIDKDGVLDKDDKCPKEFGDPINSGCPWPDYDKDGVLDKDDRCPTIPGDKNWQGCPSIDSDGDGVPDWFDRCLDIKGDKKHNGCPPIEEFVKYYKDLSKKTDFEKIGNIIFENFDLKNNNIKILIVDIAYDTTNGVVSGTTDDEYERDMVESKYDFYYFWNVNFAKLLKLFPEKIIIPRISNNKDIFISTKELTNYLNHKKFKKTTGFYKENNTAFYVFNNSKNEKIEISSLKDFHKPEFEIFNVFISNFYNQKKISFSVYLSKSKDYKKFEFENKNGNIQLLNIKNEDL